MTDEELRTLINRAPIEFAADDDAAAYACLSELLACREVLRRVEWRGTHTGRDACPGCWNSPSEGHAPGCALKARIP